MIKSNYFRVISTKFYADRTRKEGVPEKRHTLFREREFNLVTNYKVFCFNFSI